MSMLSCFFKKGKENIALTEVYGRQVTGFWLKHKWAKYLEQFHDTLSIKAESWPNTEGDNTHNLKVLYEFLLEYLTSPLH